MSYWIMYPAFLPLLCFSVFFVSVREYGLSYLSLRTCIGLWTAFFCLLLVATDASSLVCYITRFTEEAFAALICIIFIYEALEKLLHLGVHYPINKNNNLQKLTLYSYVHFSYSSCMVCLTQHMCSSLLLCQETADGTALYRACCSFFSDMDCALWWIIPCWVCVRMDHRALSWLVAMSSQKLLLWVSILV